MEKFTFAHKLSILSRQAQGPVMSLLMAFDSFSNPFSVCECNLIELTVAVSKKA